MDQQSNPWSLASLGLGVATWVVWFLGLCMGMIVPFVGTLTFPLTWLMAITGTVTGFIGYRTAMVTDGTGRGSSLGGIALNVSWIVLQVLFLVLAFLMVGGLFGVMFLAILADATK